MMKHLTALAVAAALVTTAPVAAPAAGPIAQTSCRDAKIEGRTTCIARGQFCKRSARAMADYRKYGLSCTKRDRNGRYHLQ